MPPTPASPPSAPLVAWLERAAREPDRYDFTALLALAERALGGPSLDGSDGRPRVLLRAARRLAHLPTAITAITPPPRPGDAWEITSSLLGLAGPGTPLPLALAATLTRSPHRAPLLAAIEHALLALLFRGQQGLHLDPRCLDRPLALAALDRTTPRALATAHPATPAPALTDLAPAPPSGPSTPPPNPDARHPAPPSPDDPEALPAASPGRAHDPRPLLLALRLQGPCTARALVVALRAALAPHLDRADIACDDLEATWIDLAPPPRLGHDGARLGVGLALGGRVRACGERLRLRVGPLRVGPHRAFLPGGDAHARVVSVLGALLPRPWPIDLVLVLRDPDAAPAALGSARLGDDAWLGRHRPGVRTALHLEIHP